MRNSLTIAGRELAGYFTSPMAYVAMFFFLGICGLIFVLYTSTGMPRADMTGMFHSMIFLSLIMLPVLTMGLLAQELNSGTFELLMTRPVSDIEVAVGKYLAAVGMYTIILLITLQYPIIFTVYGSPDWGQILVGYLGIYLAGLAFIAIGVFASSLTSNQIAAWLMATFMLLFFWLVGWLSFGNTTWIGTVAKNISVFENFGDFEKGIVDGKNVLYFLSLIVFFLFMTVRSLENRRTV